MKFYITYDDIVLMEWALRHGLKVGIVAIR
jgi:hypothetical protein